MRALILVAGAALAVSACSSEEPAAPVEDVNMMATDNTMMTDMNATDMNMMDANMTMNGTDMNMTDANMMANDMMSNDADTNLANGM